MADALQVKMLKQAFTAISFGARKSGKGWIDSNGRWTNPALVDIFRVKAERERFSAAKIPSSIDQLDLIFVKHLRNLNSEGSY